MQNNDINKDIKKVLILRLSALGDTIHTLPMANAIKKSYPDCKIGWLVEDKAKFFVEGNPLVDYCFVLPKSEWKNRGILSFKNLSEFMSIVKQINEEHFDVVLDTQQLWKSSSILPFLNIKRKVTLSGGRELSWLFSNEIHQATHELFDFHYHVVKRNLELAKAIGADIDEISFVVKENSLESKNKVTKLMESLDFSKPTVVLAPATTWLNKHWSEKSWSETIDFLVGKANIVITGTNADETLVSRIINNSNASVNDVLSLVGQTNLEELSEVFKCCDVVVSPDSGSAHIAWAVAKPAVVTIFSATAEERCAPFGKNCYVLAPKLDCRPCMKRKCKLKSDKNKCCDIVKSEELIELLKSILQL